MSTPSDDVAHSATTPIIEDDQGQQVNVKSLFHCPVCKVFLQDPLFLPCGKTICRRCLPNTHLRTNITYPDTQDRARGFDCPTEGCDAEHALADCNPDVTVGKLLDAVREVITSDSDDNSSSHDETLEQEKIKEAARPELDCHVCYQLFYHPVTTVCGHTFCVSCLQRAVDHAPYCPVCRKPLSCQPQNNPYSIPGSKLLSTLLDSSLFKDEVEARMEMLAAEASGNTDSKCTTPIFVCTAAFPTIHTPLMIFEPRYRLMLRRALEGSRQFGMVLPSRHRPEGFEEVGTMLYIERVQFYPDGRSRIQTTGTMRFKIVEHDILDDYIVANIQPMNDISLAEEEALEARETADVTVEINTTNGAAEGESLVAQGENGEQQSNDETDKGPTTPEDIDRMPTRDLLAYAKNFAQEILAQGYLRVDPNVLGDIEGNHQEDPVLFPWYFASLFPLEDSNKQRLLCAVSVRERLKICCKIILTWETGRLRPW
ncbi:PUA-like domain-containing protein [Podospora australis]|uniref:PUA-like domain-containing protein n=1 Tax=Podospora australis TaxID=1536484 RepID=A0AAN6WUS7_9PEZI|nr:PUA-like domain-containing protein [Podospora australis]